MKRKIRPLLALFLAVMMLISASPLISFAVQESDLSSLKIEATFDYYDPDNLSYYEKFNLFGVGATEYDGCFGNQLSGESKRFYDEIVKNYVVDKKSGTYNFVPTRDLYCVLQYSKKAGDYISQDDLSILRTASRAMIFDAVSIFLMDHPEVFWLRKSSFTTNYDVEIADEEKWNDRKVDVVDVNVYIENIEFIPYEIYENSYEDTDEFYDAVDAVEDSMRTYFNTVGVNMTRKDKLKYIHDYICNNSDYDYDSLDDPSDLAAHSTMPFFIGDKLHVCEGYAKVLKILCDRFDIPCVCVTGCTKDHEYPDDRTKDGGHMWNYVQMEDGKWYLIDTTWDDTDSGVRYTYFLANWNTKGYWFDTIREERYEKYSFMRYDNDGETVNTMDFVYPDLSEEEYVEHKHSWTSSVIEATCTSEGYTAYSCSCGDSYTADYKDKLPHTEKTIPATDSTCTQAGYTEGKQCTVCSAYTVKPTAKPLLSHKYAKSATVEADCTKDGYTTYTCTDCSASYNDDYVNATGHSYENGVCTKCGDNKAERCSHMCHKNSFIWKLLKFFFKLFRIQPVCDCGVKHY